MPRLMITVLLGAWTLVSLVAGCGGSERGPTRCEPGARWLCSCPDGTMAPLICQSDGFYGDCPCSGGGGDAGALDAAASDARPPTDGALPTDARPQMDAPVVVDAPVPQDAPQADAPVMACAAGTEAQVFQQGMRGCQGQVTFANRSPLCAAGFRVCAAAEWVARRGSVAPTYDYWTNDVLYATGNSGSCAVTLTPATWCNGTTPMRVCAGHLDPLGNTCNWIECGFNQTQPHDYFGGCEGNPTAGALCCPN